VAILPDCKLLYGCRTTNGKLERQTIKPKDKHWRLDNEVVRMGHSEMK
jgi:hypothetical protein